MNRFASTPLRHRRRCTDRLRSTVHLHLRPAAVAVAWGLVLLLASGPILASAPEPTRSSGTARPSGNWGRYIFTMRPAATQPTAGQPTAAQPTAAQPTAAQPTAAQPTAAQLTIAKPTAAQPAAAQLTIAKPTIAQPTAAQKPQSSRRPQSSSATENSPLVLVQPADQTEVPTPTAAAVTDYGTAGSRQAEQQATLFSELFAPNAAKPDPAADNLHSSSTKAPQEVAAGNSTNTLEEMSANAPARIPSDSPASPLASPISPLASPISPLASPISPLANPTGPLANPSSIVVRRPAIQSTGTQSTGTQPTGTQPMVTASGEGASSPAAESSRRVGRVPFQLQQRPAQQESPPTLASFGQTATVSRVTELDADATSRRTLASDRNLVLNRPPSSTPADAASRQSVLLNTATESARQAANGSPIAIESEATADPRPLFQDFAAAIASTTSERSDVSAGKTHLTLRSELDERRWVRSRLKRDPRVIATVRHESQDEPGVINPPVAGALPLELGQPGTTPSDETLVPPAPSANTDAAERIPAGKRQLTEDERELWKQIETYGRLRAIDDISLNILPFSHRHFDENDEVQELVQDPTMPGNPAGLLMSEQDTIRYVSGPPRKPINSAALLSLGDFCHRPLYFQEINLERYGTHHGIWQPALSAAHFFAVLPTLPYQMVIQRPNVCYHFYHPYQAGRPAPWERELPPLRLDASVFEAAVIMGLIILIP